MVDLAMGRASVVDVSGDAVASWGKSYFGNSSSAVTTSFGLVASNWSAVFPNPSGPTMWETVEIATGTSHTLVRFADGTVAGFGSNYSHQLGSDCADRCMPLVPYPAAVVAVPRVSTVGTIVDIAAGSNFSCVVGADGRGHCWGSGGYGQLGNGYAYSSQTKFPNADEVGPVLQSTGVCNPMQPAAEGIAAIDAGELFACARLTDGTVKCWGQNSDAQLGLGALGAANVPCATTVVVRDDAAPLTDVVDVQAGSAHACAIDANGAAWCWGGNGSRQLGNPLFTAAKVPYAVRVRCATGSDQPTNCDNNGELINVVTIDAGHSHSCATHSDGELTCWGTGGHAELGISSSVTYSAGAVHSQSAAPALGWRSAHAGRFSSCAVDDLGRIRCWGSSYASIAGPYGTPDVTTPLSPPVPYPRTEICDGIDNDGDGATDESCDDDDDGACDIEMITVASSDACPAGPGDCDDQDATVSPAAYDWCGDETDTNCNGIVDDACAAPPCETHADCPSEGYCDNGTCKPDHPDGTCCTEAETCEGGYCASGVCCDGPTGCAPPSAVDDTCDGEDDNCNGQTDEDYAILSCGVGECAAESRCVHGTEVPCVIRPPRAEARDGLDNDCDGTTDNGYPPDVTAPTWPAAARFRLFSVTGSEVLASWDAATDDVRVASYTASLSVGGQLVGSASTTGPLNSLVRIPVPPLHALSELSISVVPCDGVGNCGAPLVDERHHCPVGAVDCCRRDGDCDDGNATTFDRCSAAECFHEHNPDYCGSTAGCDDLDPCTEDSCIGNRCVHAEFANCCTDTGGCNEAATALVMSDVRWVFSHTPDGQVERAHGGALDVGAIGSLVVGPTNAAAIVRQVVRDNVLEFGFDDRWLAEVGTQQSESGGSILTTVEFDRQYDGIAVDDSPLIAVFIDDVLVSVESRQAGGFIVDPRTTRSEAEARQRAMEVSNFDPEEGEVANLGLNLVISDAGARPQWRFLLSDASGSEYVDVDGWGSEFIERRTAAVEAPLQTGEGAIRARGTLEGSAEPLPGAIVRVDRLAPTPLLANPVGYAALNGVGIANKTGILDDRLFLIPQSKDDLLFLLPDGKLGSHIFSAAPTGRFATVSSDSADTVMSWPARWRFPVCDVPIPPAACQWYALARTVLWANKCAGPNGKCLPATQPHTLLQFPMPLQYTSGTVYCPQGENDLPLCPVPVDQSYPEPCCFGIPDPAGLQFSKNTADITFDLAGHISIGLYDPIYPVALQDVRDFSGWASNFDHSPGHQASRFYQAVNVAQSYYNQDCTNVTFGAVPFVAGDSCVFPPQNRLFAFPKTFQPVPVVTGLSGGNLIGSAAAYQSGISGWDWTNDWGASLDILHPPFLSDFGRIVAYKGGSANEHTIYHEYGHLMDGLIRGGKPAIFKASADSTKDERDGLGELFAEWFADVISGLSGDPSPLFDDLDPPSRDACWPRDAPLFPTKLGVDGHSYGAILEAIPSEVAAALAGTAEFADMPSAVRHIAALMMQSWQFRPPDAEAWAHAMLLSERFNHQLPIDLVPDADVPHMSELCDAFNHHGICLTECVGLTQKPILCVKDRDYAAFNPLTPEAAGLPEEIAGLVSTPVVEHLDLGMTIGVCRNTDGLHVAVDMRRKTPPGACPGVDTCGPGCGPVDCPGVDDPWTTDYLSENTEFDVFAGDPVNGTLGERLASAGGAIDLRTIPDGIWELRFRLTCFGGDAPPLGTPSAPTAAINYFFIRDSHYFNIRVTEPVTLTQSVDISDPDRDGAFQIGGAHGALTCQAGVGIGGVAFDPFNVPDASDPEGGRYPLGDGIGVHIMNLPPLGLPAGPSAPGNTAPAGNVGITGCRIVGYSTGVKVSRGSTPESQNFVHDVRVESTFGLTTSPDCQLRWGRGIHIAQTAASVTGSRPGSLVVDDFGEILVRSGDHRTRAFGILAENALPGVVINGADVNLPNPFPVSARVGIAADNSRAPLSVMNNRVVGVAPLGGDWGIWLDPGNRVDTASNQFRVIGNDLDGGRGISISHPSGWPALGGGSFDQTFAASVVVSDNDIGVGIRNTGVAIDVEGDENGSVLVSDNRIGRSSAGIKYHDSGGGQIVANTFLGKIEPSGGATGPCIALEHVGPESGDTFPESAKLSVAGNGPPQGVDSYPSWTAICEGITGTFVSGLLSVEENRVPRISLTGHEFLNRRVGDATVANNQVGTIRLQSLRSGQVDDNRLVTTVTGAVPCISLSAVGQSGPLTAKFGAPARSTSSVVGNRFADNVMAPDRLCERGIAWFDAEGEGRISANEVESTDYALRVEGPIDESHRPILRLGPALGIEDSQSLALRSGAPGEAAIVVRRADELIVSGAQRSSAPNGDALLLEDVRVARVQVPTYAKGGPPGPYMEMLAHGACIRGRRVKAAWMGGTALPSSLAGPGLVCTSGETGIAWEGTGKLGSTLSVGSGLDFAVGEACIDASDLEFAEVSGAVCESEGDGLSLYDTLGAVVSDNEVAARDTGIKARVDEGLVVEYNSVFSSGLAGIRTGLDTRSVGGSGFSRVLVDDNSISDWYETGIVASALDWVQVSDSDIGFPRVASSASSAAIRLDAAKELLVRDNVVGYSVNSSLAWDDPNRGDIVTSLATGIVVGAGLEFTDPYLEGAPTGGTERLVVQNFVAGLRVGLSVRNTRRLRVTLDDYRIGWVGFEATAAPELVVARTEIARVPEAALCIDVPFLTCSAQFPPALESVAVAIDDSDEASLEYVEAQSGIGDAARFARGLLIVDSDSVLVRGCKFEGVYTGRVVEIASGSGLEIWDNLFASTTSGLEAYRDDGQNNQWTRSPSTAANQSNVLCNGCVGGNAYYSPLAPAPAPPAISPPCTGPFGAPVVIPGSAGSIDWAPLWPLDQCAP